MIKRYIAVGEETFALAYHPKTGMIYITCPRRNERKLPMFFEYISPSHFVADEVELRTAKRLEYNGSVALIRRAGPHSKLIYKALGGAVLSGLKQMERLGMSVVETESISAYRR